MDVHSSPSAERLYPSTFELFYIFVKDHSDILCPSVSVPLLCFIDFCVYPSDNTTLSWLF